MKYPITQLRKQGKGFIFNTDRFLETVLPNGWSEKRLLSVKNNIVGETKLLTETMANMTAIGLTDKSNIKDTVTNFTKEYGSGLSDTEKSKKLPHGQNMLRNRVENTLLYDNAKMVGDVYPGRTFIWLPSSSKEPRHKHMLRYGKVYAVGSGVLPEDDDFPGKARGCKCGYQWVEEKPTEYSRFDEDDVDVYKFARQKELRRIPASINTFVKNIPNINVIEYLVKNDPRILSNRYKNAFDKNGTTSGSFVDFITDSESVTKEIISGDKLSKKVATIKKDVYNPFNYMRSPTKLYLYRGGKMNETLENLKVGSRVYVNNPGFTSLDRDVAEDFASRQKKPVIFEIELSKGARMMPSMLFAKHTRELEILMAPMNSFKVQAIKESEDFTTIVLRSIKGIGKLKKIIL